MSRQGRHAKAGATSERLALRLLAIDVVPIACLIGWIVAARPRVDASRRSTIRSGPLADLSDPTAAAGPRVVCLRVKRSGGRRSGCWQDSADEFPSLGQRRPELFPRWHEPCEPLGTLGWVRTTGGHLTITERSRMVGRTYVQVVPRFVAHRARAVGMRVARPVARSTQVRSSPCPRRCARGGS